MSPMLSAGRPTARAPRCGGTSSEASTPHEPARTQRSLSGIGSLAPLVVDELAPAEAGAAGHLRQRQPLPAADVTQVLAELLRRDGEKELETPRPCPLRIGPVTARL